MTELAKQLRHCKDCSCSRCYLNGTPGCYVELAITELNRYEQAFDLYDKYKEENVND